MTELERFESMLGQKRFEKRQAIKIQDSDETTIKVFSESSYRFPNEVKFLFDKNGNLKKII